MSRIRLLRTAAIGCAMLALAQGGSAQAAARVRQAEPDRGVHRSHDRPSPSLTAVARTTPIQLDGRLDEESWRNAPPGTGFTQQRPEDGKPATQQTEIRILFDDEAIYVGARMFDTKGSKGIRTFLVRRDQSADADMLELMFDTFHDHVGRTIFGVNPSGVKSDAGVAASYADIAWDAVWDVATAIDSLGWVAEFRIPLSQLRFSSDAEQTWGLQVWRTASRLNEISMWSYWGVTESGGPQRFGHVEGLQLAGRQRRAEVLPYVVGQLNRLRPGPASDPFYDASSSTARFGADVKYLLTNNLTLDATINPDFGQVEVDPAVVNLSAFETFFEERRPFFVSGGGSFSFGSFSCFFCSNVSSLGLFYSRRIGRFPQGDLPEATDYAEVPDATSIAGAAKVTGRTKSGWTIGVLDALTARELARFDADGSQDGQQVEPRTNYFVGRVQKDLRDGQATIGMIATSVKRDLDDSLLAGKLSSHAEALGLDWNWTWKDRTYSFMGSAALSNVAGDSAALLRIQQSSARYFQRPDREHGSNGLFTNRYDPSLTRMGGYGMYARLGKNSGKWLWETAVNLRSPGFEVNDMAFLTRSDYVWMSANLLRQFSKPTSWYRSAAVIAGSQQQFNYDGDRTELQFHFWGRLEFLNYWNLNAFHLRRPTVFDDRALRGGPTVQRPSNEFSSIYFSTDSRKAITFDAQVGTGSNTEGSRGYEIYTGVLLRPMPNIQFSVRPAFARASSTQQYLTAIDDPTATAFHGRRYVLASLEQDDLSFNTRVNVTFTPTLTLEVFAQPLFSSVDYSQFKEFDAPRTVEKSVYGVDRGSIAEMRNAENVVTGYTIDPDGAGGAAQFQIDNPDFSFRSLRGNAVLRWEYRPGSTVFLVWTQSRSHDDPFESNPRFSTSMDALRHAKPDNIFLIKFNYWLSF